MTLALSPIPDPPMTPPSAPEPSSLAFLIVAAFALVGRRK